MQKNMPAFSGNLFLYRGENFDSNFYYFSGVDIDHSIFLLIDRKTYLFTPRMNEAIARKEFLNGKIIVYAGGLDLFYRMIKGLKLGCDMQNLSASFARKIGEQCKLEDASDSLLSIRSQKNPDELRNVQLAVKITKEIFDSLDFSKAKTELDLRRQILIEMLERDVEPAFEPIVASGENTRFPHYRAGKGKIVGSDIVLVDMGVRVGHYCSDLTRCFFPNNGGINRSNRKKAKYKREYERLENVCTTIVDSLADYVTGAEVSLLSKKAMKKANFPEMIHSIGHGVGLDIHEYPRLGMKSKDSIKNSVIAIEPAFYRQTSTGYGMRYEETVWFDGKKARIL